MSEFRIFETAEFSRALAGISRAEAARLRRALVVRTYPQLRAEPFFGPNIRKLRGYSPDTWRYRIGAWRMFYTVDEGEGIVYLLSVCLRRDAYR